MAVTLQLAEDDPGEPNLGYLQKAFWLVAQVTVPRTLGTKLA